MKKTIKIILITLIAVFLIISALVLLVIFIMFKKYGVPDSAYENGDVYIERAEDITDLDLDHGEVSRLTDTKGGFFGEGDVVLELQYSDEDYQDMEDQISTQKYWKELPMEKDLAERLMGLDLELPQNGYYLFYDRYKDAKSHYDYEAAKKRESKNFSVLILDNNTNKLIYIERDT